MPRCSPVPATTATGRSRDDHSPNATNSSVSTAPNAIGTRNTGVSNAAGTSTESHAQDASPLPDRKSGRIFEIAA